MPLAAGARLGPYEILAPLGAGGMGEVYRARDSRLNREVAIKVLPDSVSSDPDRRTRFAREARALAALNHPNIAAIYELEEVNGVLALILELVEGPTLADRLRAGALATLEALTISRQIADALGAAHDQGIIHRDLKPANIKVKPGGAVKVLDFGLAKALEPSLASTDATAPTISAPAMTRAGLILGTPAYMSPEQARGESLDKRTDIWSFGVVLYEMLTGRRPFEGHTTTDTLATVLKEEPEWTRLPGQARSLVRRCLEKDPKRRLRDIGDSMALLEDAPQSIPVSQHAGTARWLWRGAAGLFLITTITLLVARGREQPRALHQVTFQIPAPTGARLDAPVVSPDGRSAAFFAYTPDRPGGPRLWLYSLDTGQSRLLFEPELSSGGPPFWSPDSEFVAFFANRKLMRIDVAGSSVQVLCDIPRPYVGATVGGGAGGGSWSKDDVIVFSNGVLMRVSAAGGAPVPVSILDPSRNEIGHYLPHFLPDGRHFLYLRVSPTTDTSGIYLGSLDAKPDQQDVTRLVATRAGPVYAGSTDGKSGYLLFLRGSTLMAQSLHPTRLALIGEAVPVAQEVASNDVPSSRYGLLSASDTGVLAYSHWEAINGTPVWVDRSGHEQGALVPAPLERPQNLRLSPDGRRLALIVAGNLWVYDLTGKPPVKLTSDGSNDMPLWTPDGRRLVYASNASPMHLISIAADISGEAPQTVSPEGHYHPQGWSSDGREMIAVINTYSSTTWDILKLPVREKGEPQPVVRTPSAEGVAGAALSPDGRWLAYTSTLTGTMELWVQPYPGPGASIRISPNGGSDPVWARNGRELYYLEDDKMMVVAVAAASAFNFKPPALLFKSPYMHPRLSPLTYDAAPDGRFLMIKRAETQTAPPITVVLNWTAALKK